jgi:hypothetical protein
VLLCGPSCTELHPYLTKSEEDVGNIFYKPVNKLRILLVEFCSCLNECGKDG